LEDRVNGTWPDGLIDELAAQLAAHPRLKELVRARVEEALAGHFQPGRVWLTLSEAAERLGCTPDAVRMRINRGRLEHRRHGRRLYVSADSVDRLGRAA
jgi:excisionase family DNA binding protein